MIITDEGICEECRLSTAGYCVKHTPQVTVTPVNNPLSFTLTPFPFVPQGWQCPCCRRVFAPHMSMCSFCPEPVSIYFTTTSAGAPS